MNGEESATGEVTGRERNRSGERSGGALDRQSLILCLPVADKGWGILKISRVVVLRRSKSTARNGCATGGTLKIGCGVVLRGSKSTARNGCATRGSLKIGCGVKLRGSKCTARNGCATGGILKIGCGVVLR